MLKSKCKYTHTLTAFSAIILAFFKRSLLSVVLRLVGSGDAQGVDITFHKFLV